MKTTTSAANQYAPIYRNTAAYARENGEQRLYFASRNANEDCAHAIGNAIGAHYDGSHLDTDAIIETVTAEYGAERVTYVLANTVQVMAEDGRMSRANVEWAQAIDVTIDRDRNAGFAVTAELAHATLVDALITVYRKALETAQTESETVETTAAPVAAEAAQKPAEAAKKTTAAQQPAEAAVKFAQGNYYAVRSWSDSKEDYYTSNVYEVIKRTPKTVTVREVWGRDCTRTAPDGCSVESHKWSDPIEGRYSMTERIHISGDNEYALIGYGMCSDRLSAANVFTLPETAAAKAARIAAEAAQELAKIVETTAAHLPTLHDLHLLAACFDPIANELAPVFGAFCITQIGSETIWNGSTQYYPDLSCLPLEALCDLFDEEYNCSYAFDDVPTANYHERTYRWLADALRKVNPGAFSGRVNNDSYLHPGRENARYWFCKAV